MERLPAEIFNEIIIKLHQQDKVECMQVCRRWEQLIRSISLFDTLRITTENNLDQVIERLKNEPSQGARVERLILGLNDECDTLPLNSIFPLLPNLRQFVMVDSVTDVESDGSVYPFHKTIENIAEFSGVTLIRPLLHSNVCPRLTSISFRGDQKDIFPLLKNAPNLTRLALNNSFISLNDIEIIHDNAPKLKSIHVEDVSLEHADMNRKVKPANLVTECSFAPTVETESVFNIHLLEYISIKYPNVTHFAYSLNYNSGKETEEFLNSCLQKLKPQLKSLTLTGYGSHGVRYCFLEDDGWQIQHMKFIFTSSSKLFMKKLMASVNIQHIQTLFLTNVKVKMLHGLAKFTSLKKLTLSFDCKTRTNFDGSENINIRKVKFRDILDCCPASLESLSLKIAHIVGDTKAAAPCSIKALSLECVRLSMKVDYFISQNFPLLSTLSLIDIEMKKIDFILPYASLSCFQFNGYESEEAQNILVLENAKDKSTIYSTAKDNYCFQIYPCESSVYDAPLHRPITSRTTDSLGEQVSLIFIFKSVQNVIWNDDAHKELAIKFEE